MSPELMARLRSRARHVVSYPSGRPWLVGCWAEGDLVLARAGNTVLATAGPCSVSATELTARLKNVRGLADVETAVRGARGSFHVLASVGGRGYVRGSASGARRVYRAAIEGVTVCAERARTLAWLISAEVDTGHLAARLASPLPHPVAGGAMWRGVHALAPAQALSLEPDGGYRVATWWHPPPAELPLAQGAVALREALRDAVALRVRPGEVLGADLSGGMDSTSICFLATEAGARLVTATLHWSAPGNEDHAYAQHAAEHLPGIERLVFAPGELPAHFTGLTVRHDPADEPSAVLRDRAQQQHIAEAMRARGVSRRLSGHGGDHVVLPPTPYVHTLLRRAPWSALRHTAGWRARYRWGLGATARMLLDSRSYASWLTTSSTRLRDSATAGCSPHPQGWGERPQLPPWASEHATDLLAELLRSAAERAHPLATDRGQHAWVHQTQEAGRIAALLTHATAAHGLPVDSPFCDDAVITAALAVRPDQAHSPWSYKPLLAAAMDGLVPKRVLARTTKDHCDQEWHAGLRAHRRDLADWADDSHLVTAGVVEESELRRALLSPGMLHGGACQLENTLGAEEWLRDLAAHPTPSYLAQPQGAPR
ncbi:MAG: asparagine synthase-related protein [Pseudonocardiaceae bacterium]